MRITIFRTILCYSWVVFTLGCSDNDELVPGIARFSDNLDVQDGQIHISVGSAVKFSQVSSNAFSWDWTFEGGTPDTYKGIDPSEIFYHQKGDFDVRLVVNQDDNLTADTLVKQDYIKVLAFEEIAAFIQTEVHVDGKLTFWTYNEDGLPISCKLIENSTAIYGIIFNYDPINSKINRVDYYNHQGIRVRQEINTYDISGKQLGYEVIDEFGEVQQTLSINYSGDQFTSADMKQSDGQGGFLEMNVIYIKDFENNSFIEEYRDPLDDSFLGAVEYSFGENRNPYYDMRIEQFPMREFQQITIRKETFDASRNLISTTTQEVLGSDQLGSVITLRRIQDNVTVLEVTRELDYEFY